MNNVKPIMPPPAAPTSAPRMPSMPARQTSPIVTASSLDFSMPTQTAIGQKIIINAVEGWGKTSLGAYAPNSAIIMARGETGYLSLYQNGRVPARPSLLVDDWAGCIATLDKIAEAPSMSVLVIDAIGGIERLNHENTCRRDFKGDWGDKGFASFQKGHDVAMTDWLALLTRLDRIADKGVTILIMSHVQVRNHKNPLGPDYDRYESNTHAKTTWASTVKWSDAVLFCTFRTIVDKIDGKEKGIGGTERVMYTESTDAYTAKNRHGMPSEIEIPADPVQVWPILESLIYPTRKQA